MKIGFDAKRYFNNRRGLGNYSRNLVEILSQFPMELFLFHTKKHVQSQFKIVTPKAFAALFPALWRSFFSHNDIKENSIDLFIGASNELPFFISKSRAKSIVVIHDVMFKILTEHYGFWDKIIYHFKVKNAIKNADKIVAISEQTKLDVLKFYPTDEKKIEVIYQHCNSIFKPDINQKKQKYFIAVGFSDPKKNTTLLLQSWALFNKSNDENFKLILLGAKNTYAKKIENIIYNSKIENVEIKYNSSLEELLNYYQTAMALVFVSKYEGFGLPILEALHCNCQVVTLNKSAMKEVGKNNVFYAEENPESISQTMFELAYANQTKTIDAVHLHHFSYANTQSQWKNLLEKLFIKTEKNKV